MATSFFNPGVPLDLPSNVTRTILRIYFIGGFAIVNFVAGRALRATARMQFAQHKQIHVAHLTGWLSGGDIFTTAWSMRKPPGGRAAAILMVFILAINKAADLTISGLVNPGLPRQSVCSFSQGLVVSITGPYIDDRPPQTWQPFSLAWDSQQTSLNNNGSKGIYKKVDNNPAFSATASSSGYSDILTTWNCETQFSDQTFPGISTLAEVVNNMTRNGLLYDNQFSTEKNSTFAANAFLGHDPGFDNLVVWTSSVPDGAASSFSVKAAVQVTPRPSLNLTFNEGIAITMRPMNCSLENPSVVEAIASRMEVNSALWDWAPHFQGIMYTGTGGPLVDNSTDLLSRYLNSMFMVQASNNTLSSSILPEDPFPLEGCVTDTTEVPFFIVVLVPFIFLTIIAMGLWWLITEMRIGLHRHTVKSLPYDGTDWMLQAMREHDMKSYNGKVLEYNPRDISRWRFVAGQGNEPSHLAHPGEEDAVLVSAVPKHDSSRRRLAEYLNPRNLIEKMSP